MNVERIRGSIGGIWTRRADGWWITMPTDQIRLAARIMREEGARFAALVARQIEDGRLRLSWHWDFHGTLLSIAAEPAAGDLVPSIVDIYPGADWAEREARDYFAVSFPERAETPPLMLRAADTPGILLDGKGARA
jgi:hypothetical protein